MNIHKAKTFSIVCHVQNRYKYSIITHKLTSLSNQTFLCSIVDTCAKIYCVKYHFKQFNNKGAILKKCVLLTGGLEVSFSIDLYMCLYCLICSYINLIIGGGLGGNSTCW